MPPWSPRNPTDSLPLSTRSSGNQNHPKWRDSPWLWQSVLGDTWRQFSPWKRHKNDQSDYLSSGRSNKNYSFFWWLKVVINSTCFPATEKQGYEFICGMYVIMLRAASLIIYLLFKQCVEPLYEYIHAYCRALNRSCQALECSVSRCGKWRFYQCIGFPSPTPLGVRLTNRVPLKIIRSSRWWGDWKAPV